MAAIDSLLAQIQDTGLRTRIKAEFDLLSKQKKFGLVFEEHLPEATPLYDIPVKKGSLVSYKAGKITDTYQVIEIRENSATCLHMATKQTLEFPLDELVCVSRFGDPIYPYLKPLDSVCNAPDSDLWHTLIEADNYHALQLLEYLYAGKLDCIYIDPPYNTGAKDWKYNNAYVDQNDTYRHSKWLSFMERRLKLARKLLNPQDSVLIVTIDEKEYLHLGCLLEEMFPEARMQMISDVINPRGTTRDGSFSRTDEYIFIVQMGNNSVFYPRAGEKHYVEWYRLRRTDHESRRGTVKGGTQQFYPIYIDTATEKIVHVGEPLPPGQDRHSVPSIEGTVAVFPVKNDGTEMNWGVTPETLRDLISRHFVRVRKNDEGKPQQYLLHYISHVQIEAIRNGKASIEGYNDDGTAIAVEEEGHIIRPGSAWNIPSHNAGTYGSEVLAAIIGEKRFNFPESVYSVLDDLRYFLSGKKDALILDFFAGSGTTLHAVNLLNAEDGGHRRCIIVTNNEVSADESETLYNQGFRPGDEEWERLGIARYVTWPRTVCSILGVDINKKPLKGTYGTYHDSFEPDENKRGLFRKTKVADNAFLDSMKRSDGFKANAVYFKLGFLDKNDVALGRQFKNMVPTLWMKAGAIGPCPMVEDNDDSPYLIYPQCRFAVLKNESFFSEFAEALKGADIDTVFLVTDYQDGFRSMARALGIPKAYQLYRDYLDNFKINIERTDK